MNQLFIIESVKEPAFKFTYAVLGGEFLILCQLIAILFFIFSYFNVCTGGGGFKAIFEFLKETSLRHPLIKKYLWRFVKVNVWVFSLYVAYCSSMDQAVYAIVR